MLCCNSGVPYGGHGPYGSQRATDADWELQVLSVDPWLHRHPGEVEFHSSSNSVIAAGLQLEENLIFHDTLEW